MMISMIIVRIASHKSFLAEVKISPGLFDYIQNELPLAIQYSANNPSDNDINKLKVIKKNCMSITT